MKLDIPAIPFARAWEAVLLTSSNDKARTVTFRSVSLEVFDGAGVRLVSSDGYLSARAWVPLNISDDGEDTPEPKFTVEPDEQFVVLDVDFRAKSLLTYVRKNLKAKWAFKKREEQPDTNPTLRIETRQPVRAQQTLEGMESPLFFIDYPEHETVALEVLDSKFVDWRWHVGAEEEPIEGLNIGVDQLVRIAQITKLYSTYPAEMTFHGSSNVVSLKIGPIHCLMKTADAIREEATAAVLDAVLTDDGLDHAYDDDENDGAA